MLVLLMTASGATCPSWRHGDEVLPTALPPTPTLLQITDYVNSNSALVRSDYSAGRLAVPGAPSIPVTLALEGPLRFRLKASTAITGSEVDIGSNDELFWFWAKRQQPPALYFCRHDQFFASSARSILPVEPEWIVEAIGLPRIDPSEQPRGPLPVGANRLEIRSVRRGPAGDLTKTTVVDARTGVVLEQHLYDARGTRIASSFTSQHHRDPISGAVLPREIEIQCPTTQLDLHLSLDEMQVNVLGPQSAGLWMKPVYPGYPEVNLAQGAPPLVGPTQFAPSSTIPPPNYAPAPAAAPGPVYGPAANYAPQPSYGAAAQSYVAPPQTNPPPVGYRSYP
ncbi:MAG TPA: hypothetical protein VHX65_00325 [Pirellulales bacterium]|jgi:hypothetical protein|nr:hypothetical protein [Pirellulales bacterium]